MQPRVVRPTFKTIRLWYFFVVLVFGAGVFAYYRYLRDQPAWLMALPALLLIIPIRKQIRRGLTSLTVHDGRLTVETGMFSKSRRTMDLVKVQDVTVRQSFGQRLLGTGDLSFETASESGPITVQDIDRPREIADAILEGARQAGPPV
jgi:uncharacterized membrane protein YdbT with pleckstrin-like domain